MLSQKMQKALNGQVNAEMYSAYLYLSMSAYCASQELPGFASWMRVQAQEEMVHAMKFYDFIIERNGRAVLAAIEAPPPEWDSPLAVFENVYAHEQKVTGLINDLVSVTVSEKDDATKDFLQWFVDEQEEEEESADAVRRKVAGAGDAREKLLTVDHELGQRTFHPPASESDK